MSFNFKLFGACAMAAALLATPAMSQQTIKLTIASGIPPTVPTAGSLVNFFMPEIDRQLAEASGGQIKIEWNQAFGGSLVKLGSESAAVRDGLVDVAFLATSIESARFPLHNVTYAAPFMSDDPDLITKAVRMVEAKVPAMREVWTRNNMIFLGASTLDDYNLYTRMPLNSPDDLKGKKISGPAQGAVWVKGAGAIGVSGSIVTFYSDIQTGVSDGVVSFANGVAPTKIYEVAPHITMVGYGAMFTGGVVINKQVFDRLPEVAQKVFVKVGMEYDKYFSDLMIKTSSSLQQMMAANGAKIREVSAEERKQWAAQLPNIALAWAKELDGKGLPGTETLKEYVAAIEALGGKPARDWLQP